jgi:CRP-like cAMP-binding protein
MVSEAALAHIKQYYFALAPMPDEVWAEFASSLIERRLAVGEVFLREGQVCEYVAFVHEGLIRGYYNHDGTERVVGFVTTGGYMSEYESFLTQSPATFAVDALEPTTLVLYHREDMQRLYRLRPETNIWGRMIAEQLYISLSRRVWSFQSQSPEARYQELIAERPDLLQRVPLYMIASCIGVTPEALSRIRRRMMAV